MSVFLRKTRTSIAAVAVLISAITATTISTASVAAAETASGQATSVTAVGRVAAPATGNVSSSTSASKVTTQSFSTAAAAESYWTATRMAGAVAVPTATAAAKATAAKATVGSVAPEQKLAAAVRSTSIPAVAGTLAASKAEALKSLVTRPYTNRLDRLNGKVFFNEGGVDYVCSGTIVNSNNKDMIDTAGHCVSDGAGHFATKWVFVPGYGSNLSGGRTGLYPYGIWTARRLTTTAQWHYYGNIKQDLAYGVVAKLSNRHIAAYLGGQGTYFNVPRNQVFTTFGYPAASPFNGRDQRAATSRRNGDDLQLAGLPGPAPMKIASNLTGGSSGGGWIVGRSASTGLGYVNGHNSYRYLTGPAASKDRMYSPYYGNEALALYNYTRFL